jgi:ParB-like chromosome segregation protein Spo0J
MRTTNPTRKSKDKVRGRSKPQPKPYQFPEATEDEYESLKASIQAHGVLHPIIQDSKGKIIDGEIKKKICEELGIKKYPTEVLKVDAPTAEQMRLELNLCRKQVSLDNRRQLARLRLNEDPEQSDRDIGRLCGLSHCTVAGIREGMVVRGQIVQVKVRKGKDKKVYKKFPKVRARTKKEVEKAAALLEELGDAAPQREIELRSAYRRLRDVRKDRKQAQPPLPCGGIKIEHGDFRKLDLKASSVDLIYTDPPYSKSCLPLYGDLSEFAARVLKPGGLLITYAGVMFLPEVITRLGAHMRYQWQYVLINECHATPIVDRQVFPGYRPILCHSNGEAQKHDYVHDVFKGIRKHKDLHEWQQSIDEALYFVATLSNPGDLIVDCFGGSFTSAEAVYRLGGRKFLGCDIDPQCVAIGRERLAKLMKSHGE